MRNRAQTAHGQISGMCTVLEDFIHSTQNINKQVEVKTRIKECKRLNKTLVTFYLLLLDVF